MAILRRDQDTETPAMPSSQAAVLEQVPAESRQKRCYTPNHIRLLRTLGQTATDTSPGEPTSCEVVEASAEPRGRKRGLLTSSATLSQECL